MKKQMSIYGHFFRDTLLCIALLVAGISSSASASVPAHDMFLIDHQAMIVHMDEIAMPGDCDSSELVCHSDSPGKTDDACCSSDECKRACSPIASMMAILAESTKFSSPSGSGGVDHDKCFTSHFGNIPNPPPIS